MASRSLIWSLPTDKAAQLGAVRVSRRRAKRERDHCDAREHVTENGQEEVGPVCTGSLLARESGIALRGSSMLMVGLCWITKAPPLGSIDSGGCLGPKSLDRSSYCKYNLYSVHVH